MSDGWRRPHSRACSWKLEAHAGPFCFVRVSKCVRYCEVLFCDLEVREIDPGRVPLGEFGNCGVRVEPAVQRRCFQRRDVVEAQHGRDDDSYKTTSGQLGIHGYPGDSAIAVEERVDLGHEEHQVNATLERVDEFGAGFEPAPQRPFDEVGCDEFDGAGPVAEMLELSGSFVGSAGHHLCMTIAKQSNELLGIGGDEAALLADSLPDRFGSSLLEAYLAGEGVAPKQIGPLDRLAHFYTRRFDRDGNTKIHTQTLCAKSSSASDARAGHADADPEDCSQCLSDGAGGRAK